MIYQGIMSIIILMLVPLVLGFFVTKLTGMCEEKPCTIFFFSYVAGQVLMWALFQLVAVPFILIKSKLSIVITVWVVLLVVAVAGMVCGIVFGHVPKMKIEYHTDKKRTKAEIAAMIFAIVLAAVLVGYQCYKYIYYMHLDEDDTRFVVNAIDAYDNGTMFLTHPATGNYEGTWIGEMVKDVSSPWSIYLAALSKLTHIHPTILAHTVYPAFLLVTGYMAYYLIGTVFFHGDTTKSFLMVAIAATINMTFGQSAYNQSYFSLVRIWQGKAVVAGVMIPFLTYLLYRIYRYPEKKSGYILLIPSAMAMCLMSGMGIFFSGIMIGVYGLWYTAVTKNAKKLPLVLMACIPTIIYGLSYALVR